MPALLGIIILGLIALFGLVLLFAMVFPSDKIKIVNNSLDKKYDYFFIGCLVLALMIFIVDSFFKLI